MEVRSFLKLHCILIILCFVLGPAGNLMGQVPAGTGTLHCAVTDPSGAAVTDATVLVTSDSGATSAARASNDGSYVVAGLAPGKYKLQVIAKGFAMFEQQGVELKAGKTEKLTIPLSIEVQQEKVEVKAQAAQVSVRAENNASALVISGKDLDALSDDPDELETDLEALAGPSAGPNGGQIYIDGFTGGQLPPKSAIREIRINQNPFSAQYDRLGYGRIEILTKPGTDKLHGEIRTNFNDSALNSRNPFVTKEVPYHSERFGGNISDSLGKKMSFFVSGERRNINDSSIVSAYVLDSDLNPTTLGESVLNPRVRTSFSPRVDYQLTHNNTLTVRYEYTRNNEKNDGIGTFSLPSQAYNVERTENTLQLHDSIVLGERAVTEIRFEYERDSDNEYSQTLTPTVNVLSAFTGGGNSLGKMLDTVGHWEVQNYTSLSHGKHMLKFGARVRDDRVSDYSSNNFAGTFTFSSLAAYQITQQGISQGLPFSQILQNGGGASQFSIVVGNPQAGVSLNDAGIYAEDEWRAHPNLTVDAGIRFETQNHFRDHADFAPRIGLAWGLGKGKSAPKTVLRAGFGIFYDRFGYDNLLMAERLNGINEEQYVVNNPTFFSENSADIPQVSQLGGNQTFPTLYKIDPYVRAPYVMQTAGSIERQITKSSTGAVTYINTRGVHQLLTNNINAPLPGTYDPTVPSSGVRPYGDVGNIYQYETVGVYRQNQMIANYNARMGARLTIFSNYTLSYANGDTSGQFPSNPYNIRQDYGRTHYDIRHRLFFGGNVGLPKNFSVSPFMMLMSGHPFDITLGRDLNGDSIFNDRPSFATASTSGPNIASTPWGTFDTEPGPGAAIIPPNLGTGPWQFSMNMRVAKTFGFGPRIRGGSGGLNQGGGHYHGRGLGPGGLTGNRGWHGWGSSTDRRYNLTLSVFARNIFNRVNLAPPVGVLSSPFFGVSNNIAGGFFSSAAANRSLNMQVTFSF
jgi:Carboxypeptidase regulatory-like domain/TonB dependent receptor-like, beta-barrel